MSGHMETSVHQRFQAPGKPRERATHASRSISLIIFQATPAENVWLRAQTYDLLILRSPQLSFVPRLLRTFVRAWICTDDTGFSPASKGSSMLYLSQNIGQTVAASAGPVPPPLN